ncbi:hypothetical protein MM239_19230 [Belliella sp. DSM 111904]|uniref:Uncharacterized protein n=1 Tax=Belliella filtrata TaxID=2923435 RepID=A0ABS9V556_9BACT|nr:hypothetical protein [Belliella filtrata]MCH7411529.1 hypothetical protein [Belliella filtrata]
MKDPKNDSWKNRLKEHIPDENAWNRILEKQALDQQVSDLKNQLPKFSPKESLWLGIQKGIEPKSQFIVYYKLSAAALFLLGIWGMLLAIMGKENFEGKYLLTDISNTEFNIQTLTKAQEKVVGNVESFNNAKKESAPTEELVQTVEKEEIVETIEIDISIFDLHISDIHEDKSEPVFDKKTEIKGSKKTITVNWEEPNRGIKIDGFNVDLSEKELKAIQELNIRKKGKLRLQVNELTARLYEK